MTGFSRSGTIWKFAPLDVLCHDISRMVSQASERRNLLTDVPGLAVGCAHDAAVRTGVSVILPEQPAVCAYLSLGGGPGSRETDALAPDTLVETVDALVLAGGSVYGLAAADAIAAALGEKGRGFALTDRAGVPKSPVVPSAILYDLANGGDKEWKGKPPYHRLGTAALDNAGKQFTLGASGAGYGARAGDGPGGQGSASAIAADVTIGALAAVNCFGSVHIPGSPAYWARPYERDGEFGDIPAPLAPLEDLDDWGAAKPVSSPGENTTIACIGVSAGLTPVEALRVAKMASAGFARAIRPVFTPFDGDTVFVIATGARRAKPCAPGELARYGEIAAACLARAIARGVFHARSR